MTLYQPRLSRSHLCYQASRGAALYRATLPVLTFACHRRKTGWPTESVGARPDQGNPHRGKIDER